MIRPWSKVFISTFTVCAALSGLLLAPACQADEVSSMDVTMTAQRDSTLNVVEKITVNFSEPRHGIFRVFPVKYSRLGSSYAVDFNLNSVKDENNQNVSFSQSARGNDVNIKIGSGSKLVQGSHTYVISYKLRRAVNFFDKQPEIYWNVTGDQWPYVIRSARLNLELPPSDKAAALALNTTINTVAYLGLPNSKSGERVTVEQVGQKLFFQAYDITPGTGLTVAVRLPVGAMVEPTLAAQIAWLFIDWYPLLFLPGLTFFGLYATGRFLGTDEAPTGATAVDWEPPKEITPAEMGVLIDERVDRRDVLSIVVDLAVRGYYKIVEVDKPGFWGLSKDYRFERNLHADFDSSDLKSFEKEMLQSLFNWRGGTDYDFVSELSDLSELGAVRFSQFRHLLYSTMTAQGWFRENPDNVRVQCIQATGIILLLLVFMLVFASSFIGAPFILGCIFSAIIFFFFSGVIPARTLSGLHLRRQALGFARFMERPDKERIRVLADKDPTLFARLLPYAMVVNAADQWADAFEGLGSDLVAAPVWYQGSDCDFAFSPRLFVSQMNTGIENIATSLQALSPAASAGSGMSGMSGGGVGGGFGGGGGGSW